MSLAVTSGGQSAFHAALNALATGIGAVPTGFEGGVLAFGSVEAMPDGLDPLVRTDGAWEDTLRIGGFPPMGARIEISRGSFDDGGIGRFHRDWLYVSEMMNRPVSALVLGLDFKDGGRGEGISEVCVPQDDSGWFEMREEDRPQRDLARPEMRGMELLTMRDMLGMIERGSMRMEKVRDLGAYLYARGSSEGRREFRANLFFAAGLFAMKLREMKTAARSLQKGADELADDCVNGSAILREMAADVFDDRSLRNDAARQWLRSLVMDRDSGTRGIRFLHAMWNAWRANNLPLMGEITSHYAIMYHAENDRLEAARGLVRLVLLESEGLLREGKGEIDQRTQSSMFTHLNIAATLFRRVGDVERADMADIAADLLLSSR